MELEEKVPCKGINAFVNMDTSKSNLDQPQQKVTKRRFQFLNSVIFRGSQRPRLVWVSLPHGHWPKHWKLCALALSMQTGCLWGGRVSAKGNATLLTSKKRFKSVAGKNCPAGLPSWGSESLTAKAYNEFFTALNIILMM